MRIKQLKIFNVVDVRVPIIIRVTIKKSEKDKSASESMFTLSLLQLQNNSSEYWYFRGIIEGIYQ